MLIRLFILSSLLVMTAWSYEMPADPTPVPVATSMPVAIPTPTPAPASVRLSIEYPRPSSIIEESEVEIFFQTSQPLPTGYAVRVILNNQLPVQNDDVRKPVVFKDLKSGGHFVRAFVVNENGLAVRDMEAFTSLSFFIKRRDFSNSVSPASPMLTVNLPIAELSSPDEHNRVAFDFMVHNAPLDGKSGYYVRCVLNQQTFIYEKMETVYWKDLPAGKHRAVIDLMDPSGQPVLGTLNHVERAFEIDQVLKPLPAATPVRGKGFVP